MHLAEDLIDQPKLTFQRTMKNLPVELQTKCISLLPRKSLLSLCLVSRSTRNTTFPLLYRTLVFNPGFIGALAHRIIAENEQNGSSLYGLRITDHVRELTFLNMGDRYTNQEELRLAAEALPFLKNVCHLRWLELVRDEGVNEVLEPENSTFVQTARDVFGEKLQTLEMYFQSRQEGYPCSVQSDYRVPLFTFPHLKQLRVGSHSWKSGTRARGAFLPMDDYYGPFCHNLEVLAPSLEVLDFSTVFHDYWGILGNFFGSIDKSLHFPHLRELHIRSPFNDDEGREEGSTPIITFMRRHATQLEALSLPCPIEDFDNDYLYEPLDLPCLPNLTRLDAPVLWVNLVIERNLVPKLEELNVWLTLPKEYSESQTQDSSKEELELLLAKLRNVHTLRALDLCQSSIEFDAELVGMLATACPSLTWLGINILDPESNWDSVVSSLSQLESLRMLKTPDVPHFTWIPDVRVLGPSEESHNAVLVLAKACSTLSRLESFSLDTISLSHGYPSVNLLWNLHRDGSNIKVEYNFLGIPVIDSPWGQESINKRTLIFPC